MSHLYTPKRQKLLLDYEWQNSINQTLKNLTLTMSTYILEWATWNFNSE